MSRLNDKSPKFKPGDEYISASALNAMWDAIPRQIVGGEGVAVEQLGDRTRVRSSVEVRGVPDVTNYVTAFIVREELDDCLKCVQFFQPVDVEDDATGSHIPVTYDVTNGATDTEYYYVAKPRHLQRTYYDGRTFPGAYGAGDKTYAWSATGVRTYTSAGPVTGTERVHPAYRAGTVIVARAGVTGVTPLAFWSDMNEEARDWREGYTGNRVRLINWECIAGVPTLTFETEVYVNGDLIRVL